MLNQIRYDASMLISNVESLPRGTGCRYLLCIPGPTERDPLIAKSWHRKFPKADYGTVVCFSSCPETSRYEHLSIQP